MIAIKGGTVYTMKGEVLENGIVLVEGGRISKVGKNLRIPSGCEVIDARGKYVFPGFIDAHSHVGIFEEAVGAIGEDGNEWTDPLTPHLRALDAVNPRDKAFEDAVKGGVTCVFTGPGSANVIGGQAIAVKTYGRVIDKMVVKAPAGLKVAFGENPKRVYGDQKKMPSTRMGTAALLREALVKARNYKEKRDRERKENEVFERDLKMEVLCDVLEKKIPLRAHAHRADDIMTAVRIAREFDVDIAIEHCTEGHLIAGELAELGVAAVVGPSLTSRSKVELKDLSFKTPGILASRGVKVAIMTDHPVIPIQYLNICAALAVKEGMRTEDALAAITINAAEIIGIADRVGSIEEGKDADIVVWDGFPLEIMSKPELVMIEGQVVYKNSE
ncbi:amidohydrolase [Thermosediminibacter litoriperuensis]|uniref:Imidazolonepropionase-like amidohydrolase n=1 Tax=Thermosediminibacter litoriperuensis TaxID=291989 RepID=A0A5S5APR3_9FIRM|nr:amidohydrolase [Thermosediminibacter litoriperuensis]TYP53310.1 imidazolonepropionase-like amidohydrolase [Thermosediminibacter litoriperuensis]